ncbi:hypothetical protein DXT63_05665 [Thermoanaerobacteraceae bacterium SP2]|nr:hypothetical protein DXT63_05665 [Thermoanaerobacteraceae bacterium SP2]
MTKLFNRSIALTLVMVILAGILLTGCSKPTTTPSSEKQAANNDQSKPVAAKEYKMGVGTTTVGLHPQNHYLEILKNKLEPVGIKLEVYPGSQLGSVAHMLEMVRNGVIEAVLVPSANLATVTNAFEIINLPFLFTSTKQGVEVLNGNAGEKMGQAVQSLGLKLLAISSNGPRVIISREPFTKVEDFKGKKIRVIAGKIFENTVKAWGGTPVSMDSSELYTALQQKTIDAVDTDPGFIYSAKLHEPAKNMLLAGGEGHGVIMAVLLVNQNWYDKLPADAQKTLAETAKAIVSSEADYETNYSKSIVEKIVAEKVTKVVPDKQFESALKENVQKVYDQFLTENPGLKDLYNDIKK